VGWTGFLPRQALDLQYDRLIWAMSPWLSPTARNGAQSNRLRQESRPARSHRDPELGRARARRGQARVNDARLWHPWLRINRVLRAMLHERWSAEAWPQVKAEFKKALALKSEIRRAGWFN